MSQDSSEQDRRSNMRLNVGASAGLEVLYRFINAEGQASHPHTHVGQAHNMSREGALMRGAIPDASWRERLLARHDLLILEIALAEGPAIRALAAIQWIRPAAPPGQYDLGLSFANLPSADAERFTRFLRLLERDAGRSRDLSPL